MKQFIVLLAIIYIASSAPFTSKELLACITGENYDDYYHYINEEAINHNLEKYPSQKCFRIAFGGEKGDKITDAELEAKKFKVADVRAFLKANTDLYGTDVKVKR